MSGRESRRVIAEELEYEQAVEAIEEQQGPFAAWSIPGANLRVLTRVLDDLVAAGLLRPLDLREGTHYIRTDMPCAVREPEMHVYRCFDRGRRLLYVGCTSKSVRERAYAHSRTKHWWPDVVDITDEVVVGWTAGLTAETVAIRDEHPLHNKVNNTIHLRALAAVPA